MGINSFFEAFDTLFNNRSAMKYFFQAILSSYFIAALANSNLLLKQGNTGNAAKDASPYNFNNNYFISGSNSKKIENMFSEVKQQLAELKEQIKAMKGL